MARSIVISGASSGIGRALALEYAAPGVTLGLIGRNEARLADIANRSREKGAIVHAAALDVRDRAAIGSFLLALDAASPIDCMIANAGIAMGTTPDGEVEDLSKVGELFEVNLNGVLNTIAPIAPVMRRRGAGQIALMSSLAAFAPLPDGAAYSASKAAIVAFGLATRQRYRAEGVSVSVICPGYVVTPMSDAYLGWKPFLISAEDAARRIRRGLERRKAIIAFPLALYVAARVQQLLPEPLRRLGLAAFHATGQPREQ
jgi:short-subunit dehydrogenase